MLEKAAREKTGSDSFDNFKTVLRDFWKQEQYRNEEIKNWDSFSDIPAKECRKLLVLVKKL
jgi:hypothetical protein